MLRSANRIRSDECGEGIRAMSLTGFEKSRPLRLGIDLTSQMDPVIKPFGARDTAKIELRDGALAGQEEGVEVSRLPKSCSHTLKSSRGRSGSDNISNAQMRS